jgi:hypothetical protein
MEPARQLHIRVDQERARLLIASLLTRVFLPTLYVTWYRGKAPRPGPATS